MRSKFFSSKVAFQKGLGVQESKKIENPPGVSSRLNSFGAKFQTTFVVCFLFLKQTIAWKEVYM